MLQPGLPLLPAGWQGGAAEIELAMGALRNQRSYGYSEERTTAKFANSAHAEIAYLWGSLEISNPKISLARWAYLQPSRCPDGAIALRE